MSGSAIFFPVGAKKQVFTSSGTFNVPGGVTQVIVSGCGGGGGGGLANSPDGGQGGHGALSATHVYSVTPGSSMSVTIGTGGIASLGSGGAKGTNTVFGALAFVGAVGGLDGGAVSFPPPSSTYAGGSAGKDGSDSASRFGGNAPDASVGAGGGGGSSNYGTGGSGASTGGASASTPGVLGSGGGGGSTSGGPSAGGNGYLEIYYYEE